MKSYRSLLFVVPMALLLLSLSACSFSLAADVPPPAGYQPPTDDLSAMQSPTAAVTTGPLFPLLPPDPAQGQVIFAEKCAPCHGALGRGDGPQGAQLPNPVPPIGSPDVIRQALPSEWFRVVTQGNLERFMPPFPSLTDRQRWDVVAYVLSLATSPAEFEQGAALYQDNCANCHGAAGRGDGPDAASLPAGPPDFTDQKFMAEQTLMDFFQAITEGASPAMPAYGEVLTEDQRWALAGYLRSWTFVTPTTQEAFDVTPSTQATPVAQVTATTELTTTATLSETSRLGRVTGTVTNASGGDLPADLSVTLYSFDHMQVVLTTTTTLSGDGSYLFTEVDIPAGRIFLTTVDFEDITYGSQPATAEVDGEALDLPIQVFATTTESAMLSVDRLHFFFELIDAETLRVVELYIISNLSDRTLVAPAEGQPVIAFSLPPEATNLEFQEGELGERFIKTADGFGDTIPLRPGMGNYQVLFSYEMPYKRKLELVRPVNMPTNAVVILVPEDGVKVEGPTLEDGGVRDVQGVPYHLYNGGGMAVGEQLQLTVSVGQPVQISTSNSSLLVGGAALGVVLIVAGLWLYSRNRKVDSETSALDEAQSSALPESAETVMDAILALDDLYQEGQLPEDAYHQRRVELKARLQELFQDENGTADS